MVLLAGLKHADHGLWCSTKGPCSLCVQVVIALGDYLDTQCHACIGGTNVRTDIMKLELGQHVVVGTPGRVFDMISRRALGKDGEL